MVNRKLEWKNFKPTFKISEKGLIEQFTARDKKEARLILEGIKRKFPATDVEASMARLVDVTEFLNEKIDFSHRQIGGYKTHRAIAKIAVNFYLYSGGGKSAIQDIIEYVCKPGIKNRFVTFYYSFMSLHNLGEKEISHLLFLKGDKVKGLLYCYIELFSTANFIVILDNNYDGESFVKQYCFDIVDHQELKNKSVKLSLFQDPFEWLKYKIENDKHFRRLKNIC